MDKLVVFPPADSTVIGLLTRLLPQYGDDTPVVGRVPTDRPAAFVMIKRGGGPRENFLIDAAQINVESWSNDEIDASDRAELCRGLIHSARGTIQDGVSITRTAEFAGPSSLPDPTSNQFRFVFTMQVFTRGTTPTNEEQA